MVGNVKKEFIEKEIKYELKRDEFHKLQEFFGTNYIKLKQYEQVNYYFDSKDYELKRQGRSIRLRCINSEYYEFTIKSKVIGCELPNYQVKKESTIELDKKTAESIIAAKTLDKHSYIYSYMRQILPENLLSSEIVLLGKLNTIRSLYSFENEEEICFDESSYLEMKDYELECETCDYSTVNCTLSHIFETLGIVPLNSNKSKTSRFLEGLSHTTRLDNMG